MTNYSRFKNLPISSNQVILDICLSEAHSYNWLPPYRASPSRSVTDAGKRRRCCCCCCCSMTSPSRPSRTKVDEMKVAARICPTRGARWRVICAAFSSAPRTYVGNSGGFGREGTAPRLKSSATLSRASGTVARRCSLVQRDGRNRSGERPTSRADPGTVPRYLLPRIPPPYAVIPKDRQACAIWPHFGFPGHTLGIQTMPPPHLSLPSGTSPRFHFIPA